MQADIVTIGDEILIGQIIDTNSAYISSSLDNLGIKVRKIHSIRDEELAIITTLNECIEESELVILTGGLGPTTDDITKATLRDYFGGAFITDRLALRYITILHERRGIKLTERNRLQAQVPSSCQTLRNRVGSAPGMVFRKDNTLVVSLPGVPFEMWNIFEKELIPLLNKEFSLPVRLKRTVLTVGLSESHTADLLESWEKTLPKDMSLAYLPSVGRLRLRLSISGTNRKLLNNRLNKSVLELTGLLSEEYVFGYDEESLEAVVGKLLLQTNKTLSLAESCTGGKISEMITSVPGASAYFKGGITSYANEIKHDLLQVSDSDLSSYGAVSQQVVEQMARGVLKLMDTDYSVATSGIAGPDGGTPEKPVGTIWIAVASRKKLISCKYLFGDHRERNIERSSVTALNMLRNILRGEL